MQPHYKKAFVGNVMQPDYTQLLQEMSFNLIIQKQSFCRKCHASLLHKDFAGNVMQLDYRKLLWEMAHNLITESFCGKCHAI